MKKIPLTRGKFTIVDDIDYEYLAQWKWSASHSLGGNWYAKRSIKYKGKYISMHRVIMDAPDDVLVDHIDGDGLNNTRSNLRICSRVQNGYNRKLYKTSTTKFKGVVKRETNGKYRARISCDGVRYYLGDWNAPEDAAKEYDKKAKELFGEFARLNFPDK